MLLKFVLAYVVGTVCAFFFLLYKIKPTDQDKWLDYAICALLSLMFPLVLISMVVGGYLGEKKWK